MPEGPMNINVEPKAVEVEVETTNVAEDNVAKQQTGLTDLGKDTEAVPAGQGVHFPQHTPRLLPGGQATLKALRGQ
jgi:hypothetical protein